MRTRQKNSESKGAFLKGAVWIAAGGLIAKIIGALYRIPLTNYIGGYGLGLYQMVYPVYCLLLTVSATGIPSSIAKLTAERIARGQSDKAVLKTAMKLFLLIGVVGTVVMAIIAPFLSSAQGSEKVLGGYYTLAPSVFLVSVISVFRGWFQGRNKMYPTAISEIVEQAVKVALGLFFARLFREQVEKAVVFLLLAVSVSELVALLLMIFLYRRAEKKRTKNKNEGGSVAMKAILRLSIPVTFNSVLIPLSGLLDSILAPRLLGAYATDAVTLFGLFSGGAVTIINLPVSVCYGIAAASIPRVAMAHEKKNGVRKRIFFSLGITALVSGVSAVGLYLFAEPASKIIFRSLKGEELTTLIGLVKAFSLSAFSLSCAQTLSACLTAQGKPQYAALSMLIAVTVKTVLYVFFLRDPNLSVFGLAYATNVCYLVAFLLDLVYNLIVSRKTKRTKVKT
ncbi:MAG: polysaccharide biosynthesis protein [Clostridiales bacterium]|nr:polysaccharide biosynthesis protein [Clostridiales bacterium]